MKKPAYFSIDNIHIDGNPQKRLMVVFRTNPCSKYLEGKKCFGCGYEKHALEKNKPSLLEQYESVKNNIKKHNIKHVDLLSSGSLLDGKQASFEEFVVMFRDLAKESIDSILVEGRAEYFDEEKIKKLKDIAKPIKIEYGVGLESWDNRIRNDLIKKELNKKDYIELLKKTKQLGISTCTYLLYGIPGISKKSMKKILFCLLKKYLNCIKKIIREEE